MGSGEQAKQSLREEQPKWPERSSSVAGKASGWQAIRDNKIIIGLCLLENNKSELPTY